MEYYLEKKNEWTGTTVWKNLKNKMFNERKQIPEEYT